MHVINFIFSDFEKGFRPEILHLVTSVLHIEIRPNVFFNSRKQELLVSFCFFDSQKLIITCISGIDKYGYAPQ